MIVFQEKNRSGLLTRVKVVKSGDDIASRIKATLLVKDFYDSRKEDFHFAIIRYNGKVSICFPDGFYEPGADFGDLDYSFPPGEYFPQSFLKYQEIGELSIAPGMGPEEIEEEIKFLIASHLEDDRESGEMEIAPGLHFCPVFEATSGGPRLRGVDPSALAKAEVNFTDADIDDFLKEALAV